MKPCEVFFGRIPSEMLFADKNELALRLKTDRNYTSEVLEKCEKELKKSIDCGYSAIRTEISFPNEGVVDVGFAKIRSHHLYKNLFGCKTAFIFAVTLGYGVDRLIKRLAVTSVAEYFITDGLASAYAECAAERTDEILCVGKKRRPRFSPGYGDFSLEYQKDVLAATEAAKRLNIALSESCLMSPSKSVTAIIGVEE